MLLLLLLSHFSHVRLCETPETAAHQAPPSLGFSRQEHWSGNKISSYKASSLFLNKNERLLCYFMLPKFITLSFLTKVARNFFS